MKIQRSKLLMKTFLWLSCEVFFNFMGVDTLADYGEFLLQQKEPTSYEYPQVTISISKLVIENQTSLNITKF